MTIEELRKRIRHIVNIRDDDEAAHGREDELREDVLKAIANGVENSQELAKEVLLTSDLEIIL